MSLIDAEDFSKVIKDYFHDMITHHKYNVDCVDCNADLQHLLDEQPTAYDVDKVVEELKNHKDTTDLTTVDEEMVVGFTVYQGAFNDAIDKAISIVQEAAEEYDNGWIPISDRFPENDTYILLSFDNFSMPMIGRYESYESGGAFYITCLKQAKQDLFINAWQPLPEPYQPKGE